ncbi:hypothetical protein SKAU_G00183670 [Synaphobranchus kaupii]|uniref:C2H2-type domain-containing protein n=1 Tax=Synaphobranchus kaupii TaxID=118154 RepID=A0A9Q1FCM5_SYNKA|nr:hypothetical protein SKAU_G00183670 [Synaphobranchus kaupii]
MLMETMSFAEREIGDPSHLVSSLHLLVPPLQLLSAAMWQVLQQQDVLHYGKLEEFVSLVTEAFPELLSETQRTELTLGLQQSGCKTDPALEVLLWEFLSTLDQLLPVPDLTQTVSWLSAAPSVLEVCLQSVYYPDQLKTLLRHHRSLGQLDMNATLPFIEEYKLSSMSRPPCQRVVDTTKLTNTNSQSESITDCMNCLRPASSDEDIQAESVMDCSDYIGMEPTSISNRCEDIDEKRERKTVYLMSREKKDLLTNVKEEEEDGERQSVKMEREDGVRDEEELWKEEEETDEQMEGHATDLVSQTDKLLKNHIKSEHALREGEELSTLVTSCLLKKPRVLIRRLEIANSSLPVSSPPHLVACQRGQGARSPWGQHELSPLRGNGSLTQKKGQVGTRKRNTIGQLERPLKMLPSSSENGICAEASLISPFISPRNQNIGSDHTGQTVEVSYQVCACSHCPFVHTEEVNLHQHIEKVHPEELTMTLLSAAMWQVLQQQDMLHYGKLEEFVSLVTEAFPELLSKSQRTELTLGLQVKSSCKTDPALEVLLWEFLSTLDQLLPVPDLTQTVSWLRAAPSALEVCLQSVYYPDQLKTLLRHHRSLGQLDMNAKLPFIEQYKLSSMSHPPCQRVVDSTKLTNTNSQSESITDCMNCLRPASSGEDIQAESVMDSSDYTGMEPTSISNRCEDIDEKREMKTVYLMSRQKKDLLTNVKEEEEEDGERQSVKMEREDGVRDEEELCKEEEETDEQMEGHATDLVSQTDKLLKNGIKSEHALQEGEELSTLVTSCLLKKPRVLIRRLEIANSSLPVSSPHLVACQRGQGARSPWGQHELSPLRGNGSLTQKNGQVVNRKRNTIGQLERPPKMLPSSSENRICAEASLISPVISPRNQNTGSDHTGQSVEVSSQVFACSQCPFVHTEEVNLHQHIEKVHPQELNTTVRLVLHNCFTTVPILCTLMETMSFAEREIGDPSYPVSSLHLLVPPLQLLSAAMWQVLQQQDVLHYGKLEEFVSLVTEAFPELLSESQRTELTLGLQQSGCKTDPALEVLLWEFLSTLDQLLPVPDLTQTVSWLSAAPSVLEVCLQFVYYPDQLKTLLRHHRSLGQLDMNATLPFIEEYKLSSMSRPPCQRVVGSTKLTNTNSQSESITDCMNCLRPASSDEDIQAESVMDSSDYTGMEQTSISNRCEDEKRERKTVYLMSRQKKELLTNINEEEEDGERQSVKMEREDGMRDEEELWKEEEETDEQMEGHATDLVSQTDKLLKNGRKSEQAQREGEELSTLVTSCLLKKPRVLIRRLEIGNSSLPLSSPPHLVACQRGQGARSSWGQHELSPQRGNRSLTQKKGQVVTQKRNTIGQLERPPKMLLSSSENGICAEASLISPVMSHRNQNTGSDHTGQTVEVSSQVFACSHCPFVQTEEVNLHQHIEKVHPEELKTTLRSQQSPSSTHQHPTPPKTTPTPTQYPTGTPGAHTCSHCGKHFRRFCRLRLHQRMHTWDHPHHDSQSGNNFARDADSAAAAGLLAWLVNYDTLASLYLLYDLLPHLSALSRCFQRAKINLVEIHSAVQVKMALVRGMRSGARGGGKLEGDLREGGRLAESQIIFDERARRPWQERVREPFIDLMILEDRFQVTKLLSNVAILDPAQLPDPVPGDYGLVEAGCLAAHYGAPEGIIDPVAVEDEWLSLREYMKLNRQLMQEQLARSLLSSETIQELLPGFATLMCALGPVGPADCKRAFNPSHPVSSLHLLVPPLQLLSAAMWQVLQQQDVLHYGKLEEFVSLVMETFPELLSESQRTELTLGLQQFGCKTDPALEVLLWEFLSTLDQLLPVPDLTQTVSWLSAAPSVLDVCLQFVYYPDQLKTLLRHHRSLGQLDMNATLPFIEEYKLSSMSRPPCQRVVDSTKLTNTNSQSESITDCMNCLRPASSGEDIQAESVMDSSDYTGMEPTSISNRYEDKDEKRERKTVYLMSREKKDLLTNMNEEEEDGKRQSVKMEREDGMRDEEELWKEEEETDEQMEGHATDLVSQTDKLLKNGIKSEQAQREGEELSTLVTSCLLKKPRVLIRRLEIGNSSLPLSSPPHLVACQRGQGARSPWGQHELSPLRGNRSLTQKKGQVVTRKRNTIGQLERPLKMLPSSSENGICAEASLISPVISPRNQNTGSDHTGQTVEVSSQVFACSQCPFVHTEEINLNQHIEKVHPEELNTTIPLIHVSSLHLLVPPLQLLSAAMWQVLQQQDVLHYGKLEEFVSLVMDTFPELLSESQRTELTLGLQSGCKTDPALEVLLWEFLSTLDQLLPVSDLTQQHFPSRGVQPVLYVPPSLSKSSGFYQQPIRIHNRLHELLKTRLFR